MFNSVQFLSALATLGWAWQPPGHSLFLLWIHRSQQDRAGPEEAGREAPGNRGPASREKSGQGTYEVGGPEIGLRLGPTRPFSSFSFGWPDALKEAARRRRLVCNSGSPTQFGKGAGNSGLPHPVLLDVGTAIRTARPGCARPSFAPCGPISLVSSSKK